jgi:hypothetical protein
LIAVNAKVFGSVLNAYAAASDRGGYYYRSYDYRSAGNGDEAT